MPYRQWQFRLGLEGLAILRTGTLATDETLAEHVSALTAPVTTDDPAFSNVVGGAEVDVAAGYAQWAAGYDAPGNPLISHEQPVVHDIFRAWPVPLRVLDVACGTGRHAVHLAASGHDVTGVDASPAMLARAAAKRDDLTLVDGFVEALPFPTNTFDAVVCSLLFDHLADIHAAVGEMARVVRPGGRVLISNIHPTMSLTGAHAAFRDLDGDRKFMRSTHHSVSANLNAFRAHGLAVVRCEEPSWTVASVQAQFPFVSEAVARDAIAGLPMAIIWGALGVTEIATGIVGRHRRVVRGLLARVVEQVTDEQWALPTPCTEWDARALLEHLIGFHDFLVLRPLGVRANRPKSGPAARWEATRSALFGALDEPGAVDRTTDLPGGGQSSPRTMLGALTTDVLVHTWDLAVATSLEPALDLELCDLALAGLATGVALPAEMFAAARPIAPDADAPTRLLAHYGRDPAWSAPSSSPA